MKKGLYIKKVMGKKLFPLGFTFSAFSGIWIFERMVHVNDEDFPQQIHVQKSNFGSFLYFRIKIMAYGQRRDYAFGNCIPGLKEEQFYYNTDDEFKELIDYFAETLLEYVVPFVDSKSVPTVHISQRPSKEDIKYVGINHERLAQEFMEENDVTLDISLDELFKITLSSLEKEQENTYQEAKESLFKAAMFFSEWVYKHRQGKWETENGRADLWYSNNPEATVKGLFGPLETFFMAFMRYKDYSSTEDQGKKAMELLGFIRIPPPIKTYN